jgi:hypothetical protein
VWHARPVGGLGTLQIAIRAYGSNIRLLQARTSANREDSLSRILYIYVNLGENDGNI